MVIELEKTKNSMKPDQHKSKASREYQKKHGLLKSTKAAPAKVEAQPEYKSLEDETFDEAAEERDFKNLIADNNASLINNVPIDYSSKNQFQFKAENAAAAASSATSLKSTPLFEINVDAWSEALEDEADHNDTVVNMCIAASTEEHVTMNTLPFHLLIPQTTIIEPIEAEALDTPTIISTCLDVNDPTASQRREKTGI